MSSRRAALVLILCAASCAAVPAAVLAARTRATAQMPAAADTSLQQSRQGAVAGSRLRAPQFSSPDASAAVAPRVMTPQDRLKLREQIQSTEAGRLPQPEPRLNPGSN